MRGDIVGHKGVLLRTAAHRVRQTLATGARKKEVYRCHIVLKNIREALIKWPCLSCWSISLLWYCTRCMDSGFKSSASSASTDVVLAVLMRTLNAQLFSTSSKIGKRTLSMTASSLTSVLMWLYQSSCRTARQAGWLRNSKFSALSAIPMQSIALPSSRCNWMFCL